MAIQATDEQDILEQEPATNDWSLEPVEEDYGLAEAEPASQQVTAQPEATAEPDQGWTLEPVEEDYGFGVAEQETAPAVEEESFLRPVADPFLNIGASINDVVKGFTDAFGADNAVSQNLAKNSEWYRSLLSAGAKEDQEEIGRIMQEAEGQGVLAEVGAGLKALSVAPIDLVSQGIGSLIPFIATAGLGKAVGLSKAGIAVLQGVQGGVVSGGIVKGEIYDAVKEQLINSGVDEAKAEKAAQEAQAYNGKNLDQILLGVGLGVAASTTGADSAIRSLIARKVGKEAAEQVSEQAIQEVLRTGFVRGAVKDGIVEAATEGLQGGQERLAANVAVGREGFDVEPMRGVVGQATLEGVLGGIIGGGAGGISAKVEQMDARQKVALRDAQKAAEEAKQSNAPASAAAVEEQINQTIEETPDERVARLQREAQEAAGEIELEEEVPVSGLPPVEPVTPPVTPTPEAAVAPVEPPEIVEVEPAPTEIPPPTEAIPPKPPTVAGFTTAQGSTYEVTPEGKTVRTKVSEGAGQGQTFEPHSVLFVQPEASQSILADMQSTAGNTATRIGYIQEDRFVPVSDSAQIPTDATPTIATVDRRNDQVLNTYTAEREPQVGLSPVEKLYKPDGTSSTHIGNQITEIRPTPEAAPAAVEPTPVTPPPVTPQLEPLRRVARAEQTEDDVAGLVDAGFVEVYKGQPVITQAGLETLPEAERPRLTPEARKIQIDTRTSEAAAEAISKNLRIGVDQVPVDVRMPAGWTLVGDVYVPPAVEAAPEVAAPEAIAPEKQVVPQEQEQVAQVVRVDQEQVNQGKPDVAKIINQFTVLERAAVAGKLLEEGYIDGKTADRFVKEATNERTGGFSMAQIGDAQASADEKFNQQIAAARTSQPVAGEVSPEAVDLEAEQSKRSQSRERVSPAVALKPKSILGKTAREALAYLSSLNLSESKDWDAEIRAPKWTKDPNYPKPFYAQIQDAAAILSKLPLKILDADKIVSNAERGFKGGAKRFGDGDIGIPLTETARVQTASGSWVRRSVEKPLNVATLVHEVGHTLTADAVNRYITSKNPKGSEYLKVLDSALKAKSTPQPIKDLIVLYKTTISQLGLEKEYFGKKGLAGGRAKDSQLKAYNKKIVNNLTGNPFTWSQYYGLANIDEFVAQAWSSQSFQDLLKQIKAPDQQSLWTKFTRIIRDLFGFPSDSMASAVIDVSMQIAELETPIGARKGVAFSGVQVEDRIAGRGEEPAPPVINIWQAPEQEITSQETSINERKIPAVFNQVKEWKEGTVNADIGGGRFDNVTNWLRDRGVENLIIDWFNRDRAFNEANINRVRGGRADTATISNVLNVIQEPNARELVIRQAADALKEDGTAYFYIYEGNGSGQGRATTKGWQENRKAASYMDEISQHFENVERRNQMIVATGPIKEMGFAEAEPEMPSEAIPTFTEGTPEAATLKEMATSMAKVDAASEAKGGKPETYKISEIASVWMDSGLGERELQDAIVEYTNLTPANAARVAKAIARQYDIQQSIATAFLETQTGLSVEALPEGVTLPKEVDPDRPKPVMQRLFEVFMGVRVPPVKITGNEKTFLKQQIRLKAAANRAAKGEQQKIADAVVETIKEMELRGPVRPRQAQALAKRAAKVLWTSEKSVEAFTEYAAKVVENTNYDADLREAKAAQKRAKELSKQKKVAMSPQREILSQIGNVAINKLEDPRLFAETINYYLRGFKDVRSPEYVVVPDAEMVSYISQLETEAGRDQIEVERESNERLARKYDLAPDTIPELMGLINIIEEIEGRENREALEKILTDKAIETQEGLRGYDTTSLTNEQKRLVDAMNKVDLKSINTQERQMFIRIANNMIYNNQTNGAEYFVATAQGQQNAREAARDAKLVQRSKAWIPLIPSFGSLKLEETLRNFSLELQSIADTFRNVFGKDFMAKAYEKMGMLNLNEGFTKANNTIDEIQDLAAEFHQGNEKKFGDAASDQDGILSEGVAGFLIQSFPFKDEATSIEQRRNLINEYITNARNSRQKPRVAMADRVEAILNKIDGNSVQEILKNLKREYPANHEVLMWYKDVLFPKYKGFLKQFDENFNDQANNYDSPNYLPISFTSAGPALAVGPEDVSIANAISLQPKQSVYTIKRQDYTTLPKDRDGKPKEIEFNLRRTAFNSLSDQINKAYTSAAWQQLFSFMKTPESVDFFGDEANRDFFVDRLNRLRASRARRGSVSGGALEKALDAFSIISRKLGTGIALGGAYQWIKQPPDQLITAWGSGGRGELLAKNLAPSNQKAARALLNLFSIGRRGDSSAGYKYINQMEGHQSRMERYFTERRFDRAKEQAGKIADVWMIALKKSDFIAASAAWMTYYEGELNKNEIYIDDWAKEAELIKTDPVRREAAAFAENMTDIYQGSSDPTSMATFAQSGKTGWENFTKALLVPFNSFAIQQRMRLYSDARDALLGNKSGVGGLAGTIGGLILFHATKRYVIPAASGVGIGILYGLMGVDMDEPDEEKRKEMADRNWRQFLADMTGNLLVGGTPQIVESEVIKSFNRASYLVAMQLESESVMDENGEIMSFDKYSKERSPFYRYQSYDNAMSLGMFDIGLDQAKETALQTKMVMDRDEMDMYTPEEQRLLYFSALSEWLLLMRLNDTDFARLVKKARRDMIKAAEDREKEIKRIREGR